MATKQVKVIEVEATHLDPDSHYLVCFERSALSAKDAVALAETLREQGLKTTVCMVYGNPNEVMKVYAIPKEINEGVEDNATKEGN